MRRFAVVMLGVWAVSTAFDPGGIAFAQAAPAVAEQHTETAATRHEENDVRLSLTAGSSLSYGNARNVAVNVGADFVLRMNEHALTAQLGWLYGIASTRDSTTFEFGPWNDSANNLTWKIRYDLFLTQDDAIFAVHRGRRDPFASLDPRIGLQVGYMRNFVREDKHRFWGEIGYDFTYDRFPGELEVGVDDMGNVILSNDRTLHSLRLFIGYDNRLNEVLTYQTGFEALMRLDRPEHWRFEWINQLRSKLADWLQISLDITGRLDSLPPGQREAWNEQPMQPAQMFDVIATLNLVGTFDLYSEPEEEEEEEEEDECECPEPCADANAGAGTEEPGEEREERGEPEEPAAEADEAEEADEPEDADENE